MAHRLRSVPFTVTQYSHLANQRGSLDTTLLTVEATLLGFIVAILAIVLGYAQASRFEVVRKSRHWIALFESYTRAMRLVSVRYRPLPDWVAGRLPGQQPSSGR